MDERKQWPQIVGIGSSVYDTLMVTPRFPEEDTKIQGIETKIQGGGPCATALVAASKLGVRTAYMGTLGDDPFGTFMKADFEKYGVDTRAVIMVPGGVSFHSVVLLSRESASRTCIWNRGTVPPPEKGQLDLPMLMHAKILHVDGHMLEAAMYAAQKVHEAGGKVSYDAGGTYPGVEELLPMADYLIPSEEFARKMTGADAAEEAAEILYRCFRPEVLVITEGKKGGILLDGQGLRRYESYPVEAVDTNGCGDTFHGAFAAAKIYGMDNDRACRYASAAAAMKCMRLGAREAIPTDSACRAFLRDRGVVLEEE